MALTSFKQKQTAKRSLAVYATATIVTLMAKNPIPKLPFRDRALALGLDNSQPDNYYRDELIQALGKPDARYCWDFGIQFQY